MDTITEPHLQDLQFRGWIKGLLIKQKSTGNPLCYYYGGLPYGLPPVGEYRFRQPRQLAPCYQYGTRDNPGVFTGKTSVCPQPGRKAKKSEEDCLQVNIYVPAGTPPTGGWPVYFYIHGGFLQFGSANEGNPVAFLTQTQNHFILVKPSYRLNTFGFLASEELLTDPNNKDRSVGNYGFWDQRLALEWTWKNITYFGGNASNITIGGYSAGAHSVFYQLQYDLYQPKEKKIIQRAVMHSNGPGLQPRALPEAQEQFNQLVEALGIDFDLPAADKLARLRKVPAEAIIRVARNIGVHQFRGVSEGIFISHTLFKDIRSGAFGRLLRERNVKLWIGDCLNEHFVYATWRPPVPDSYGGLERRLCADYTHTAVAKLMKHYYPDKKLPPGSSTWQDAFGHIYADIQVHVTERGLLEGLEKGGATGLVHRYRIEWRSSIPSQIPWEWGATHGADGTLWFYGDGRAVPEDEQVLMKKVFLNDFAKFVKGETVEWASKDVRVVRRLKRDGSWEEWRDDTWDRALQVWRKVADTAGEKALL